MSAFQDDIKIDVKDNIIQIILLIGLLFSSNTNIKCIQFEPIIAYIYITENNVIQNEEKKLELQSERKIVKNIRPLF